MTPSVREASQKWPNFPYEQKLSSKDFVSGWQADPDKLMDAKKVRLTAKLS